MDTANTSEGTGSTKPKKLRTVTVTLSEPVEFGSETFEELVLRRPRAKDLENLSSEPKVKELLEVARRCANVPRSVMDRLDGEDAMTVVEAVADFLDSGQKTGKRHSFS